jgi:hypothetical protein
MRGWGLVIGSGFDDPRGVENDAELIGDLLTGRGFAVDTLLGPRATRAGILAAWDAIIAGAQPDDAVAIYYAGHGALVLSTERQAQRFDLPAAFRAICPTDYGDSSDDDFRGISSFELSIKLAALTAKTRNVTVILDCCYSGHLCRGGRSSVRRARGQPAPSRLALARHLGALRDSGALADLGTRPNPDAVRIVGAGESSGAFPTRLPEAAPWRDRLGGGGRDGFIGALTRALYEILHELGDAEVPWQAIAPALFRHVRAHGDGQQPDIEGAVKRVPFRLTELDGSCARIERDGAGFVIGAGRIAGVSVGDVYAVRSALAAGAAPLARATIESVASLTASGGRLDWLTGETELPIGAVAVASELAFERRAVRIIAAEPDRERIAAALAATGRLRPAGPGDRDLLAEVELAGDRLAIRASGEPLFDPVPYPDALGDAAADLAGMAMVHRLRALAGGGIAASELDVAWGTVVDGVAQPRPDHGFALGLDDAIFIRLANRSARTLYAHVFNIGLRDRIALLGTLELPPHSERALGADLDGDLRGLPLTWPAGLARTAPGLDTLLTIATAAPADLRMLETSPRLDVARGPGGALVDHLLGETGGAAARGRMEREPFAMVWRDFWLCPLEARLATPGFEIDDKPFGVAPIAPADGAPATELCIRLGPLDAFERSGSAGPRSNAQRCGESIDRGTGADLRIDALVCTRTPPGAQPYGTRTVRCTRGPDGRLRALDDDVLWRGPVQELVDVYLWSSSGLDGDDLAELMRRADTPRMRDAVSALCDRTGARASSLPSAGSTALAALAYDLLHRIARDVRGLVRTSPAPAQRTFTSRYVTFAPALCAAATSLSYAPPGAAIGEREVSATTR